MGLALAVAASVSPVAASFGARATSPGATFVPSAVVSSAASERAETYWELPDPPRDARYGIDTEYSSLSVETHGYYVIKLHGRQYTPKRLNAAEVYLDAKKANPGPEFKFVVQFTADRDGESGEWFSKLDSWRTSVRALSCPRWHTRVDYDRDRITFKIPRACLNRPERLRWNVVTWNITEYHPDGGWYGYYDAVPDWRTFARDWVA